MYNPTRSSWEWYRTEEPQALGISTSHFEMEKGSAKPPKPPGKKKMLHLALIDPDKQSPFWTPIPRMKKKMLTMRSFDPDDGRFRMGADQHKNHIPVISTYTSTFVQKVPEKKCDKTLEAEPAPDFLWNRRPKSVFHCNPWNEHKFMDDQLFLQPSGAKKIDFFRQLRNTNFPIEIKEEENGADEKILPPLENSAQLGPCSVQNGTHT